MGYVDPVNIVKRLPKSKHSPGTPGANFIFTNNVQGMSTTNFWVMMLYSANRAEIKRDSIHSIMKRPRGTIMIKHTPSNKISEMPSNPCGVGWVDGWMGGGWRRWIHPLPFHIPTVSEMSPPVSRKTDNCTPFLDEALTEKNIPDCSTIPAHSKSARKF